MPGFEVKQSIMHGCYCQVEQKGHWVWLLTSTLLKIETELHLYVSLCFIIII